MPGYIRYIRMIRYDVLIVDPIDCKMMGINYQHSIKKHNMNFARKRKTNPQTMKAMCSTTN